MLTLKRVVATLRVQTFFCGWNRMMCIFGAKRHPSTTDPLRLTEMHIVVVCTYRTEEKIFLSTTSDYLLGFFKPMNLASVLHTLIKNDD